MIQVDGKEFSWREGMTVSDLLNELEDSYPYAVVRISERLVSAPDFPNTRLPDNSEVNLIPLIVGG
jgi:thiamine biosynthesis protein ThiS